MALFKCKMCGGSLEIAAGTTVIECEYCGTQQTLPKLDDDRLAGMHDRANHFRRNSEYDKAMAVYEQLLNEDNTDAEAYWSLVLCRYGIEYVEDPSSHKRVPTVNRAQFTSIYDDDNYKSALQYADTYQKSIYEAEAKAINEIQKGILEISQKEEPFDVFICYKESDAAGRRTPDSVLANELYHQLIQEGFKVFFSRITLEDKLGSAYEPYIFAALNSAKVMVVLGTKPEYFSAVWVKNEWSRFLGLIKQGQNKILIPAYKDMDAYDLPDEFSHLQAQDMTKLGFMQDLIRGIKKIAQLDEPKETVVQETIVAATNANTAPLLKRVSLFLEKEDWDSADEYCERVLDIDPECAEAYVGKLMAELQVTTQNELKDVREPFDDEDNYQMAIRFADAKLKAELEGYVAFITNRNLTDNYNNFVSLMQKAKTEADYKSVSEKFNTIVEFKDAKVLTEKCLELAEEARLTDLYDKAVSVMQNAKTESEYKGAADKFVVIKQFKDAEELSKACLEKAETARKDAIYNNAVSKANSSVVSQLEEAIKMYESIPNWKDSAEQTEVCKQKIADIKANEVANRNEAARIEKRKKMIAICSAAVVCVAIVLPIVWNNVIVPGKAYKEAISFMNASAYDDAITIFEQLGEYKDSKTQVDECMYKNAIALIEENVIEAYETFVALEEYKDSSTKVEELYADYIVAKMKPAQVGDYVILGAYEQDNNTSNGKEDVEWLVLEKQEDKILVISKYALDCKKYNEEDVDITWETCTLRNWLNSRFINEAFLEQEKAIIQVSNVSEDKNPNYNTNPSNTTRDKVFLLSVAEANKYFDSDNARKCQLTAYADAKNGDSHDSGDDFWWLRSPGESQDRVALVRNGSVDEYGDPTFTFYVVVRPAMWLSLE